MDINAATIREWIKKIMVSSLKGTKSPMADIEPYLVSLILQLANMRAPITTAQGLQLCNSIIKGTKFQHTVSEFQKHNLRSVTNELGPGYWRGFLNRNKHLIKAKRAVKFDTKRAEWCTYQNLEEMYNEVYSVLSSCFCWCSSKTRSTGVAEYDWGSCNLRKRSSRTTISL